MDYIFWSVLRRHGSTDIVASYDIACQYGVKFRERMQKFGSMSHALSPKVTLEFVIPMFHIIAHVDKCQTRHSLHYQPLMARTDGENIERGWANLNAMSMPTKEMSPGSCHDTLNKHLQGWNWTRIISLGQ